MNRKKWFVVYLLSLVFLFLFFRKVDFFTMKSQFLSISWKFPALFALFVFINFFVRAFRWRILLQSAKPGISVVSLYHFIAIGYLVTYALPGRLGELARPVLAGEKEGISKSIVVATVVFERILDTLCILILFLVSLIWIPPGAHLAIALLRRVAWLFLGLLFLMVAGIFWLGSAKGKNAAGRVASFLARIVPRRYRQRMQESLQRFFLSLNPRLNAASGIRYGLWTITQWISVIFSYWLLARGFPGLRLGASEVLVFFAFIYVSSAVPLPGMAGSLDLASRFALVTVLGNPEVTAVAYTVLFHFLLLGMSFFLGIVALWSEGIRFHSLGKLRRENEMP